MNVRFSLSSSTFFNKQQFVTQKNEKRKLTREQRLLCLKGKLPIKIIIEIILMIYYRKKLGIPSSFKKNIPTT